MSGERLSGAKRDWKAARCLRDADHDDIAAHLAAHEFFWLDLDNPDQDRIEALGKQLSLHRLTIEDALTFSQRPKFEEYPGYAFMVIDGVDPGASAGSPLLREVHMIVSGDYVITIHRRSIQALDELNTRYHQLPIRSEQFLVYKILDAITATFFPVLARIDDDIDDLEDKVLAEPTQEVLQRIFALKRDLVAMRRVVSPMRDVFARNIERLTELPGLELDDRLYFRDLYDATIRISDLVDSYRDLLSGSTDLYLSTVANRQGNVAKQLTMIATIFLPLTFVTGFFGQNFSLLTGHLLTHDWTFWVLGVGLPVAAVVGFLVFFRTRRWI